MIRRSLVRRFGMNTSSNGCNDVHPDVQYGSVQRHYRGPGWMHHHKFLPQQNFLQPGGMNYSNHCDRQGPMPDPEDPRHPMIRIQLGEAKGADGHVSHLVHGDLDAPVKSVSRFLQVLYDNYLEPWSMNRMAVQMRAFGRVPNWNDAEIKMATSYVGETVNFVGGTFCAGGSVVMEGTVVNGAVNDIMIGEASVIQENCSLMTDQPTTLHHYQRDEEPNPYQTIEMTEGFIKLGNNVFIEPNCMLESCQIGACARIGHNTKILKGVNIGILAHVLPGSVVVPDTNIPDGELWGGAPAVKLGKVCKWEWKRPFNTSLKFGEAVLFQYADLSRFGDGLVEYVNHVDNLQHLLDTHERDIPDGVKEEIRAREEGKEPFHHAVARITQGWKVSNRADNLCGDHQTPCLAFNYHSKHNDDAEPHRFAGTVLTGFGLSWVKNQR